MPASIKKPALFVQTKTKEELEVLRYVNAVASTAHVEVVVQLLCTYCKTIAPGSCSAAFAGLQLMRKCRPGLMEYALESIFRHSCYLEGGCRRLPYTPICARCARLVTHARLLQESS